ncbi:MAG: NADH-quinone oxidoreductase subunit N, partial [Chloroflexi bacterium]|nr:NADH-quinone oxidoreductase subunit N [Chloroflexota bacterium]
MNIVVPEIDLRIIAPALVVAITALVVLVGELATPPDGKRWLGLLSLAGLAIAAVAAVGLWGQSPPAYAMGGMVVADNFGVFLTLTILLGAAISILLAMPFLRAHGIDQGEYYVLLLASVAGMIVMATAADLIVVFLGLELLSLPLYILAAFDHENNRSLEAGIKYFLLGAFSSAFFLYGIALVYGATASTNLAKIQSAVGVGLGPLLGVGAAMLIAGFAFKVALVPFHWWTPDVYDGAPTTVTAFMSVAVKAAAFGAFFRVFQFALPALGVDWRVVLSVIAVLTMTLGNVAALVQSNIKRMLAYSSIAHAGYILIALVAMSSAGVAGALFYLLAYTLTNLGAFGAVIALSDNTPARGGAATARERLQISDFAGAAREHPWVAFALSICLLSLAV